MAEIKFEVRCDRCGLTTSVSVVPAQSQPLMSAQREYGPIDLNACTRCPHAGPVRCRHFQALGDEALAEALGAHLGAF